MNGNFEKLVILRVVFMMILLVFLSCKESSNKEEVKHNKIENNKNAVTKSKRDPSLFYITNLDSINNLYIVYAKKGYSYYKIISEKLSKPIPNCNKIKLYENYSLDIISIVPDTSKISLHLDGILYNDTEILFEKDSIWDLYQSSQLKGLCIIGNEHQTVYALYKKYLEQLESVVEKNMPLDHSDSFQAVAFLSEISGYSGNGNHSYFGTIGFKKEDLRYWKKWFEKNKDTLDYVYIPKDS